VLGRLIPQLTSLPDFLDRLREIYGQGPEGQWR
jgi:hypothetical protein